MKRLTWLAGFTIVAMAMPLSAIAGGHDGKDNDRQEKRVEIRVERERSGERGGQRDGRNQREDRQRGGDERRQDGEGMRRMFDNMHGEGRGGNWQGMREHAGRMFRGIHDRAMNIHFQPQVEDSQVAIGFGNKNVQAEVINLNINIGDVIIDGNEVSGGDASEMLQMIMKMMMMKEQGQGGPGMGGRQGMHQGGPGMGSGPGNNGPGPWHDRFDGNRPPHPDMPPHEAHGDWHGDAAGNEYFGEMMRSHGEHGIHLGNSEHNAQFDQQHTDLMREYNVIIKSDNAPVEPGDVRSPYHQFYFGNGEMPHGEVVIIEEQAFHGDHEMQPRSAQMYFHGGQTDDHDVFMVKPQRSRDTNFGSHDMRPEIMELAMQIPDEVPAEFVEMIFRLGQMAWHDEALRERLQMLIAAEYETGDIEYQRMLRAYLLMLVDEAGGAG